MKVEITVEDFLNILIAVKYYPLLNQAKQAEYGGLYERLIENSDQCTTSELDDAMCLIDAKEILGP